MGSNRSLFSGANQWTLTRQDASAEWRLSDLKEDEKMDSKKTSSLGEPVGEFRVCGHFGIGREG